MILAAILVFSLVPGLPNYQRGLFTGMLLTLLAWLIAWRVWVTSGLSLRLNGVWAEDAMAEKLRASDAVFELVRNFKFDHRDIDAIAVTHRQVLVVEVKWSLSGPKDTDMDHATYQAARGAMTLRRQAPVDGLPPALITPVVIYCGPQAADMEPAGYSVQHGPINSVLVLGAEHVDAWLQGQSGGPISREFAAGVAAEIERIAQIREASNVHASWLVRRLARAK